MENLLFGKAPVSAKNPKVEVITVAQIYNMIKKDSELKKNTILIRKEQSHTERKKLKAQLLSYVLPFKYKELIRNSKNFESANCMFFEADDVKDIDKVIQDIEKDPLCCLLYTSVSGNGFKILVKLNTDVDEKYHLRVYNVLRLMINKRFDIVLDPSSKDMARVQYLSYDPNCIYNKDAIEVDALEIIKNLKIIDSADSDKAVQEDYNYDDAQIKRAIKHIRKNGYLDNKDEQLWWELSMSIASLGEAGREYFLLLSEDNPQYPEDTHQALNKRYDKFLKSWGNYHDEERILNMNSFFNKIHKVFNFKLPRTQGKHGKKSLEFLLADKFVYKYRDLLLYDHSKVGKGKGYGWYTWAGTHFELSKKGEVSDFYLKFIEDEKKISVEEAKKKKLSEKNLGMDDGTEDVPINVESVDNFSLVQIAKAESRRFRDLTLAWAGERDGLGVLPDELDKDQDLFCCLNGVIDLRTQQLLTHSPKYKITKISKTVYQKNAKCPNWENFINKISFNNSDIYKYIQEAVGYTLTGHTSEQCLFFLYGIGANGKSTFLEGLKLIFGDYQIHANYETFTNLSKDGNSHSEDVVRLKGSRLVISSEINANKPLNESVIKQVTGGDVITARDLHSSSIEFTPTFKLWIAGNHKPKIQNFDHGIKRRIFIIPFEYTFTPEEIRPQHEIINEFKQERSGILNWALEGTKRWVKQKHLNVPDIVLNTTKEYFLENNVIEQFLLECCSVIDKEQTKTRGITQDAKKLYLAYVDFINTINEPKLGRNSFYNRLEELGYKKEVTPKQQLAFKGLKLKEQFVNNNGDGYNQYSEEVEVIVNNKKIKIDKELP